MISYKFIVSFTILMIFFQCYPQDLMTDLTQRKNTIWVNIYNEAMGLSVKVPTLGKVLKKRLEKNYMRIEINEIREKKCFLDKDEYILEVYVDKGDTTKLLTKIKQECIDSIKVVSIHPLVLECIPESINESFSTRIKYILYNSKLYLISIGDNQIGKEISDKIFDSIKFKPKKQENQIH